MYSDTFITRAALALAAALVSVAAWGQTPVAPAAPAAPAEAASAPAVAASAPAAPAEPAKPQGSLDTRVQDLKAEIIRLNRDLLILEEELLFPAGTQVAVFVSMDVGKLFELESVQVKLNDKVVAQHLYTGLEVQALHRGTTIKFDKGTEPRWIELRIKDSTQKLQPEFDVKVWN
jgi:hypothetical protein